MKKIGILLTVLALTFCFFGCGEKDMPATTPTDNIGTEPIPTVVPTSPITDPTMDTNIPDPTVDSNSTENGSVLDDMTTPDNGSNGGNSGNSGTGGTGNAGMGNG